MASTGSLETILGLGQKLGNRRIIPLWVYVFDCDVPSAATGQIIGGRVWALHSSTTRLAYVEASLSAPDGYSLGVENGRWPYLGVSVVELASRFPEIKRKINARLVPLYEPVSSGPKCSRIGLVP